jgi:type IV pilus assembly protein PilX
MNKEFQRPDKKQRGAVLALTLILLVVISVVAIATLKSSISGEQISKNMRTNVMALQSAETALRLCENAVRTGADTIDGVAFSKLPVPEDLAAGSSPISWKIRANWASDQGLTTLIPTTQTVVDGMRPTPRPRCMVEQYRLPRLDPDSTLSDPYLITAVGYSSDYQADSNGNGVAGSEVWIQTVLRP